MPPYPQTRPETLPRPPSARPPPPAGEEDEAFNRMMYAFVDRLNAMSLQDLLDTTAVALSDAYILIDRKLCRRDRLSLSRACVSAADAEERIRAAALARAQHPLPVALPVTPPPSPQQPRAPWEVRVAEVARELREGPQLPFSQLSALLGEVADLVDSSDRTPPPPNANR